MRRVLATLILTICLSAPLVGVAHATAPDGPGDVHIRMSIDAPGSQASATFGVSPDATDGYDEGLDRPVPPPPPGGDWTLAFFEGPAEPAFAERLECDMRSENETSEWLLHTLVSSQGGNVTLTFSSDDIANVSRAWLVQLVDAEHVYDLRQQTTFERSVTADTSGSGVDLQFRVRILKDPGPPPSPPRNLTALPGPGFGDTTLSWEAPASEGGAPVRAYEVYAGHAAGALTHLATTFTMSFVDHGVAIGRPTFYTVTAVSDIGESPPSNASIMAGSDAFATPPSPRPGWTETTLVDVSLSPSQTLDQALPNGLRVRGQPTEDGYELVLDVRGVNLTLLGRNLSREALPVHGIPAVDSDQLRAAAASLAPSARIRLWEHYDPAQRTCIAVCAMVPPEPTNIGDAGWEQGLFAQVQIEGIGTAALWIPLAGQVVANGG